jgi:hypothetical protein
MTLPEFLLARFAEDEADARQAAGFETVALAWSVAHEGGRIEPDVAPTVWAYAEQHIARWDPARVLAECDAKRRIVDMVRPVAIAGGPAWTPETAAAEQGRLAALDYVLRDLASVYADHPDYRKEWRP